MLKKINLTTNLLASRQPIGNLGLPHILSGDYRGYLIKAGETEVFN